MRSLPLIGFLLVACSGGGAYFPKKLDGSIEQQQGDGGTVDHDMAMMKLASCSDGIKNGTETDIDCGGGGCEPCAATRHCLGSTDCQSNNCQTGTCQPAASCSDGIRNGNETDTDCGGSCSPCSDESHCNVANDCQSKNCLGQICQPAPTCFDGIKNGNETDVDCGGPNCSACNNALACNNPNDCQSVNCSKLLCCSIDTGNCDGNPGNGCEASLLFDGNNCGSCGHVCPNNTPACSNGGCVAQSACDPNTEVSYNGHCYYLDGNGGFCDNGYVLASQTVLATIGPSFAGKNYKHKTSDNCCIYNADIIENYGLALHCDAAGPLGANDVVLGGAGCNGVNTKDAAQLTLCVK